MPRIIQISDCHLFADPARELRGVATWKRLHSVLEAFHQHAGSCEYLVVTGDTAHDEMAPTYEAFRDALAEWRGRVLLVPGNHDQRDALRAAFPESCRAQDGRVVFEAQCEDWTLIGLDSQVPGAGHGELGPTQREWLERRLDAARDSPTALFLHHPPIPVDSPWLDAIGLRDRADFTALLERHPQVRLVACGHVHQELAASLGAATVLVTPAVGPQFRARTSQLEIDSLPPGYRILELEPRGRWSTQVLRSET